MCKLIEAVGKRYEERTLASAVKRKKKDAADKEKPIMQVLSLGRVFSQAFHRTLILGQLSPYYCIFQFECLCIESITMDFTKCTSFVLWLNEV